MNTYKQVRIINQMAELSFATLTLILHGAK